MNSEVKSLSFQNETTLISSGVDAEVYIWDIRKTSKCIAKYVSNFFVPGVFSSFDELIALLMNRKWVLFVCKMTSDESFFLI